MHSLKNFVPQRLKRLKFLDDEHKKSVYSTSVRRQQSRKKIFGLFGTKLFQIITCVFVPFFVIFFINFGCFRKTDPFKTCDESDVRVGLLCIAAGYFYYHQGYE